MPIPSTPPNPRENRLLAVLPEEVARRMFHHFERVSLPLGATLYVPGGRLNHLYFPSTAIVSLLHIMDNGASGEIAVVGSEGVVGIALFLGGETMPNRAVVQSAGYAYRIDGQVLKREFNRSGALHHLLLRYILALEPIAKLPVAMEPKPGEGQERLFLAPFSVCYAIFHYGAMDLSGFPAIERRRLMASTPSPGGVTAN